ncbi:MAG: glutathione S-transferase [Methylococcales bacterium]|jgi:glutathione S-transferase|nr:glutathione S-transferase [Methylococcales bacterium]MBT7411173.1 glutathione S-transferase [Methylococcales bacterium]
MKKSIKLYQFPISHYCEKVRWTLDYKKLDYQVVNLLPVLHLYATKKLSNDPALPIIEHDGLIVQNSSDILDYLDKTFPEYSLIPVDPDFRQQVIDWETFVDKEIGLNVRCFLYNTLLEYPEIMISFFTHQSAWYGKLFLKTIFPVMKKSMRESLCINDKTAEQAKIDLQLAIEKIYLTRQATGFLVGNLFSRADLATASLLAPLCRLEQYGMEWPK